MAGISDKRRDIYPRVMHKLHIQVTQGIEGYYSVKVYDGGKMVYTGWKQQSMDKSEAEGMEWVDDNYEVLGNE